MLSKKKNKIKKKITREAKKKWGTTSKAAIDQRLAVSVCVGEASDHLCVTCSFPSSLNLLNCLNLYVLLLPFFQFLFLSCPAEEVRTEQAAVWVLRCWPVPTPHNSLCGG